MSQGPCQNRKFSYIKYLRKRPQSEDQGLNCRAGQQLPGVGQDADASDGLKTRPDDVGRAICESMAKVSHYELDASARERLRAWLARQPRGASFGNARLVRNAFEQAVTRQASRVVDLPSVTDHQLMTITSVDIPE